MARPLDQHAKRHQHHAITTEHRNSARTTFEGYWFYYSYVNVLHGQCFQADSSLRCSSRACARYGATLQACWRSSSGCLRSFARESSVCAQPGFQRKNIKLHWRGFSSCGSQRFSCWREALIALALSKSCGQGRQWLRVPSPRFAQLPGGWDKHFATEVLSRCFFGRRCDITANTGVWNPHWGTVPHVLGRYRQWPNGLNSLAKNSWVGWHFGVAEENLRRCPAVITEVATAYEIDNWIGWRCASNTPPLLSPWIRKIHLPRYDPTCTVLAIRHPCVHFYGRWDYGITRTSMRPYLA